MQVNSQANSYVFKSPYSSPVQTGQPDPTAQKETSAYESKTEVETTTPTQQQASSYVSEQKQSQNVANASANSPLQNSLDLFTNISSQLKAQQAYA